MKDAENTSSKGCSKHEGFWMLGRFQARPVLVVRVSVRVGGLSPQTSARQRLHPEDRPSSTDNIINEKRKHSSFVYQLSCTHSSSNIWAVCLRSLQFVLQAYSLHEIVLVSHLQLQILISPLTHPPADLPKVSCNPSARGGIAAYKYDFHS